MDNPTDRGSLPLGYGTEIFDAGSGLIGMLAGQGDSTIIMATIPVALTSTLYGIVLENFFFSPLLQTYGKEPFRNFFFKRSF
ncbi:hypothetical protein [Desulforapulum autotrophicum]|uniref:hypothetical protein n=1 Tax=Desulforapulum autotrophicum TaxID=2296 RepID=UPI00067415C6|nr:hypothetical protein [Desulforapulum autotrophicum]